MEPGSVHDIAAARAHRLDALYAAADLPTLSTRATKGERDKLGEARGAGQLAQPLGEFLAAGWSSGGGVGGCGVAGEGFGAGVGVALEGAHGGVPGPGEQLRGVGAALGVVGQSRVT